MLRRETVLRFQAGCQLINRLVLGSDDISLRWVDGWMDRRREGWSSLPPMKQLSASQWLALLRTPLIFTSLSLISRRETVAPEHPSSTSRISHLDDLGTGVAQTLSKQIYGFSAGSRQAPLLVAHFGGNPGCISPPTRKPVCTAPRANLVFHIDMHQY